MKEYVLINSKDSGGTIRVTLLVFKKHTTISTPFKEK